MAEREMDIHMHSQSTLMDSMKKLRCVVVYPAYSEDRIREEEDSAARIRSFGYDVIAFGIPATGGWWPFQTLDKAWKEQFPPLMQAYEKLEDLLSSRHVLIAAGGSMLHPEFISRLSVYTVFICADDPESSEILSKPVAPSFDFSFMFNISCLDMYKSWGCRNAQWLFYPLVPGYMGENLSEGKILSGERDIDIVIFSERVYGVSDRCQRIEQLAKVFPQALVRGKGWEGGYISKEEMIDAYYRAKIGWNLHNSTGPTNQRTTMLPSYGVMEICDNKQHLGKLFKLDEEIVGFDTLQECIDKTRYYLEHDRERREIAARGWRRVVTDYTEQKLWARIMENIADDLVRKLGKNGLLPADFLGNTASNIDVMALSPELLSATEASFNETSISIFQAELSPIFADKDRSAKILNLASGHGGALHYLSGLGFTNLVGVEQDEMLAKHSAHVLRARGISIINSDMQTYLRAHLDRFDVIIAYDLLQFYSILEAAELLQIIKEAIKPGGMLIIRTPNMANVLGTYFKYSNLLVQSGFTEHSMAQLLQISGYESPRLIEPVWPNDHPFSSQLREAEDLHEKMYALQGEARPRCVTTNLLMAATNGFHA